MGFFLSVGVVVLPVLVLWMERRWSNFSILADGLAALAAFIFGMIITVAVYQIRRDETVFMTNIHQVFENELFLLSGAFLGVYGIARIIGYGVKRLRDT